ncbi:MAG: PH domain-containing protein [Syntrophomonadaceae bacterium]|jgi:hypothetical protein
MVNKSLGIGFGVAMFLIIFGFFFWGIGFSLGSQDATLKLLLYIPLFFFLFLYLILLLSAFNLNYIVANDGLVIKWGLRSIHINWEEIEDIIKVEGQSNLYSIMGISWPGYTIGVYVAKGLGSVKMYATSPLKGFIYIKSSKGSFGITPSEEKVAKLLEVLTEKTNKKVDIIDMETMDPEIKGQNTQDDTFYRLLYWLNIILLLAFGLYLALFFPGSGAPKFTILLLILAVALFFFNISNAGRVYQFSSTGGYIIQLINLGVTGLFIILAFSEITL